MVESLGEKSKFYILLSINNFDIVSYSYSSFPLPLSWKKRARRDPCEIRRQCQIICKLFQHVKQLRTVRCLQ